MPTTAAALIIGDEILTGKFTDLNSPFLIKRCRELGISLRHIAVISDRIEDISAAVTQWSHRVDWVFTTGGVGPTHDDLTMAAIAKAFGVPLHRHTDLKTILQEKFEGRLNEDVLRMAEVPKGAVLWREGAFLFPQVVMENVVIFPGVPRLFQKKFDAVAHRFGMEATPTCWRFVTLQNETDIATPLRELAATHPAVAIGSYPQFDVRPWSVTITLESRDLNALSACAEALGQIISVHETQK